MRYESTKTPKGNIGVSHTSQEEADAHAAISRMDYEALAFWRDYKPTIIAMAKHRGAL